MEFHGPPFLIDGHVHLHPCFDEERFFTSAAENFASAGLVLGFEDSPCGILMLTESCGENRFADLRRRAGSREEAELTLKATGEERSLLVASPSKRTMLLVAGRQLVTSERLEVLALGCAVELPDGDSLEATLDRVREAEAIPVIPWGFGKWHSSRRQILVEVLKEQSPSGLFLGDNGGRAALIRKSSIFRGAAAMGIRNLPGSDPLPFAREQSRAGSFGVVFDKPLDPFRPATDLLRLLAQTAAPLQVYGTGLGTPRFVRNQVAMQIRKRSRRKQG
jgi:hypothetical protein